MRHVFCGFGCESKPLENESVMGENRNRSALKQQPQPKEGKWMNENSDKQRTSSTHGTQEEEGKTAKQMIVLGIRISPKSTRYALVKSEGMRYILINADTESKLVYPAGLNSPESKADWLYRELERIIQKNPDIKSVCIKVSESRFRGKSPTHETYRLEGVILLLCHRNSKPVKMKKYKSLGTKRADVKACAKERVGPTTKYWTTEMADAVVAAWSEHPSNIG